MLYTTVVSNMYLRTARGLMVPVTLNDFRATLRLSWGHPEGHGEKIFSYWNNESVTNDMCNREEVLHIVRRPDSTFYLQIGNQLQEGQLEELERALFEWALDEGWFDCDTDAQVS
jgi:hypothetical protein